MRLEFLSAPLLALFLLAGVAYAGGGGGSEGYHGHMGYGKGLVGASRPSGGYEGHEGKSHPGPGPSHPSDKSGGYRQKGRAENKIVSPIGDREGYEQVIPSEACRKFFDETEGLRKVFDEKRATHFKSRYDPATSPEEVADHRAEIHELWRNIEAKNTENCRWVR